MNRLKKAVLIGTIIAVLGAAGAAVACKNDHDVPIEPTHITSPTATPTQSIDDIVTPTATPQPTPSATPIPNNPYDFGKSLGLEAAYLEDITFDANSRGLISYLASLPVQMRSIAERSGLLEDILTDKKVDAKESVFFNRVIGSYQNEIKTMQPWLAQLPENEVTSALALNLRNFREAGYLTNERVLSLLSPAIFFADGVERMYAAEINDPVGWRSSPRKVYASTMVENITNFLEIQKKAWEVANNPNGKYGPSPIERSIEEILHAGYFQQEAVGSTDKGQNAYLDMKLLWEQGSPEAKAALRIYARNMTREGRQGSAPQVRVELTEIDLWSIGIHSYEVVLAGHDVPTIPLTLEDIALLKGRSPTPLLILEIDGSYHLPLQWTRKSIVQKEWEVMSVQVGTSGYHVKVSELKNY